MRIIAIETSGRLGTLAAQTAEAAELKPLAETTLAPDAGRTAQALAPALEGLLEKVGWPAKSIDLVAVAVGPGSFTGLRLGVTTAKTLAYAVGAEIVGVNTLATLADAAPPSAAPLWTILDAQREELFIAKFALAPNDNVWQAVRETAIVPREEWLAQLQTGDLVTGPPLRKLASRLPAGVTTVPDKLWEPMAAAVGRVAWRAYQQGQRDDVWQLVPVYYRLSAAEEKAT